MAGRLITNYPIEAEGCICSVTLIINRPIRLSLCMLKLDYLVLIGKQIITQLDFIIRLTFKTDDYINHITALFVCICIYLFCMCVCVCIFKVKTIVYTYRFTWILVVFASYSWAWLWLRLRLTLLQPPLCGFNGHIIFILLHLERARRWGWRTFETKTLQEKSCYWRLIK